MGVYAVVQNWWTECDFSPYLVSSQFCVILLCSLILSDSLDGQINDETGLDQSDAVPVDFVVIVINVWLVITDAVKGIRGGSFSLSIPLNIIEFVFLSFNLCSSWLCNTVVLVGCVIFCLSLSQKWNP